MLKPSLVTAEGAREIVLAEVEALPGEAVDLRRALGRVTASPVVAAADIPPFDNSAMDGYAVRAADVSGAGNDTPALLRLAGESRAGHPSQLSLQPEEAIAISTGAVVPDGADSVVRLEDTRVEDGRVRILSAPGEGLNVRRAGEDLRGGEMALPAGTLLGPAELGVLASVGCLSVECHRRPSVSVLVTGDELREPGRSLLPGQIHDSNSYSVPALAQLAGATLTTVGRASDTQAEVRSALEAILDADVVVVCGGISVGSHDHVRGALGDLGVHERFWGVALRPGKPTWFGVRDDEAGIVFGLPGNPVSAIVTFLLFVRPALLALSGRDPNSLRTTARLDEPYPKKPGRAHAIRCRLRLGDDGWHVRPTKEQGSHVLTSMLGADCLAFVPTEAGPLDAGTTVQIEMLPTASLGEPGGRR